MKTFFCIIREFLIILCEAIIKRLPFRKNLCWLFGHLYQGVYLKKEYSLDPQGEIVADTETGCIFCNKQKQNQWAEYQLDRNREL
jgi:hypothetical protein